MSPSVGSQYLAIASVALRLSSFWFSVHHALLVLILGLLDFLNGLFAQRGFVPFFLKGFFG